MDTYVIDKGILKLLLVEFYEEGFRVGSEIEDINYFNNHRLLLGQDDSMWDKINKRIYEAEKNYEIVESRF